MAFNATRIPRIGKGAPLLLGAYALAVLLVSGATLLGLAIGLRWGNAPVVLLYLPAVLAAAVYGGLPPALLAAVSSTLAYNYYFLLLTGHS